jgi:signal transduction histidine kinase
MSERVPVAVQAYAQALSAWYQLHAYPMDDGLAVFFQNITEQRGAEDRLRETQKMEAIGQLSGGIAHDFNNLLTIIIGNMEILVEELSSDEHRHLSELVLEAAERGADLTRHLLAFGRRQPLQSVPTCCEEVVRETVKLLQRTLGEKITVTTEAGPDLWPIVIDRRELENALINLAINSRDAMPEGGTLTIRIERVESSVAQAVCAELAEADYVMVSVSDTGVGIPQELTNKVVEPFFTTKARGKGTGLGLSGVFGFVKQSGGHLQIESQLGCGTTIKMFFPRQHAPSEDGRHSLPQPANTQALLAG